MIVTFLYARRSPRRPMSPRTYSKSPNREAGPERGEKRACGGQYLAPTAPADARLATSGTRRYRR